ncbi:MAG TPA: DoxX family protein [Kofleriaceae bacterium]|jgi:uncharacterized membrane protein YphA (DoxX/SURF4 family)|nr:DoxX family protein [Kofleriaceae bacterium]
MTRIGRIVFGAAMIALGAFCFRGDFFYTWSGIPDGLPARAVFSCANGVFLIAAGLGVMIDRLARAAALALAALWLLYTACHVPRFVEAWRPYLGQIAEPLGLASCALVLAARGRRDPLATLGRVGFGVCLPLYGVVHFLYPQVVAEFIPVWIPARLFWAYFTACAFIAAGLAVLSGVLTRTAAVLVAVMFTSWAVVLHIPRLCAALGDPHEWATVFVALAFAGAAWIFAGRQAEWS